MNYGGVTINHEFYGDKFTFEANKVRRVTPSLLSDCQNPGTVNSPFDGIRDYSLGLF